MLSNKHFLVLYLNLLLFYKSDQVIVETSNNTLLPTPLNSITYNNALSKTWTLDHIPSPDLLNKLKIYFGKTYSGINITSADLPFSRINSIVSAKVWNNSHVALKLEQISVFNSNQEYEVVKFVTFHAPSFEVKLYLRDPPTLVEHYSSDRVLIRDANITTDLVSVIYDNQLLESIVQELQTYPNIFSPDSRMALLRDYFELAREAQVSYSDALNLTQYLGKETDENVWMTSSIYLREIFEKYSANIQFPLLKKYIASKTTSILSRIGIQQNFNDTDMTSEDILRFWVTDWNCRADGAACEKFTKELFAKWNENPGQVAFGDVAILPMYQRKIAQVGGREAFEFAFKIFEEYLDPSLIYCLGFSQDSSVLSELYFKLLDPTWLRPDIQRSTILKGLAGNWMVSTSQYLNFLSANFDHVKETEGAAKLEELLEELAKYKSSAGDLYQVEAFITENQDKFNADTEVKDFVTNLLKENIVWMTRNSDEISTWLKTAAKLEV